MFSSDKTPLSCPGFAWKAFITAVELDVHFVRWKLFFLFRWSFLLGFLVLWWWTLLLFWHCLFSVAVSSICLCIGFLAFLLSTSRLLVTFVESLSRYAEVREWGVGSRCVRARFVLNNILWRWKNEVIKWEVYLFICCHCCHLCSFLWIYGIENIFRFSIFRTRYVQHTTDIVWGTWKRRYIQSLMIRHTWKIEQINLWIGYLVISTKENQLQREWITGRSIETYWQGQTSQDSQSLEIHRDTQHS